MVHNPLGPPAPLSTLAPAASSRGQRGGRCIPGPCRPGPASTGHRCCRCSSWRLLCWQQLWLCLQNLCQLSCTTWGVAGAVRARKRHKLTRAMQTWREDSEQHPRLQGWCRTTSISIPEHRGCEMCPAPRARGFLLSDPLRGASTLDGASTREQQLSRPSPSCPRLLLPPALPWDGSTAPKRHNRPTTQPRHC